MIARTWMRRVTFVAVTVALGCTIIPAEAQDALEGTVRVGVILPEPPGDDPLQAAVIEAAEHGIVMAQEEFAFNAEMFGITFEVVTSTAPADDVTATAQTLVEDEGVFALIGGLGSDAQALGDWAEERGVPFINIGDSSDSLRNDACAATTFHVAPSAAMYLDAMAGWYVRAGFRRWYIVQADNAESAEQYDRLMWSLENRFFGAEEIGHKVVAPGTGIDAALADEIANSRADLVVLLLDTQDQLAALTALNQAATPATVAGFPYNETQTRAFFDALIEAAPDIAANFRASAWEATLDAYGARELNARYRQRWDEPMQPSAWAAFVGVKIFYEAAFFGGSTESESVLGYLENPQSVFDVWKGIGTSFRPWNGQLRQPVYLVEIDASAPDPFTRALLVGELPAIYLPGTEPLERLDQLGDLEDASTCSR